jgi:hypothetical protein
MTAEQAMYVAIRQAVDGEKSIEASVQKAGGNGAYPITIGESSQASVGTHYLR